MRAALLLLQSVRFVPCQAPRDGPTPQGPGDVLRTYAQEFDDAIAACKLAAPGPEDVQRALEGYRMLTDDEVRSLVRELP